MENGFGTQRGRSAVPARRSITARAAAAVGLLGAAALVAGCAGAPAAPAPVEPKTATITRTTHGVAHVSAPDLETLAYAVAHAHAEDNVCQTASQLVTVRGERSRFFGGGTASGPLGLRTLPHETIDFFARAHFDDGALAAAWGRASADAQAMARGYVAGYNRFLADRASPGAKPLPAACAGQPWLRPMTIEDWRRLNELTMVQAGVAALADALVAAQPPAASAPRAAGAPALPTLAEAAEAVRETGLLEPGIGSNAWAFGRDATADGRGLLLGNPHFPWVGVNRFWQLHLTVPGRFDVMGASIGHTAVVQIGFNGDVAWSHTVSTGKRFTLHELALVPGDPTSYVLDGQPRRMQPQRVTIQVRAADGTQAEKATTVWRTRFGPVVAMPRAGLGWTAERAYALQDANTLNVRSVDTWLGFAAARNVGDMTAAMTNLGIPWVNTLAADRDGRALYADASVVPDVDAAQLQRCAPSEAARRLFPGGPGIVVLDGSRSDCDWRRDPASPVQGLTPIERMPVAIRTDWVQNSNDSFVYAHWPAQRFDGISPLVGDAVIRRPRTRAGMLEVPEMLAPGKATAEAVQRALFANRSLVGRLVLPDLKAACAQAPAGDAKAGCEALARWDGHANLDSRALPLATEFWRTAQNIPNLHRVPFDANRRAETPAGLRMDDATVAAEVWKSLDAAVKKVRAAGFALDAPLWAVQVTPVPGGPGIAIHGGDEHLGVLNKQTAGAGIGPNGMVVDHGTSYVQTVGFDARGPVAQALLVYGQSSDPGSPHAFDQMRLYPARQWPVLPFHADDVQRARIAPVQVLRRP